ncbi:MAG: D-Ala-D-Ala carboxypeptidase family metallohydrolase [Bdellovibrionota bacterium]
MKSKLAAGFAVFLMMTTAACGEKSSPEAAGPTKPAPEQKSPNTCWLYEKYEAAECVGLAALSSFSSRDKAQYNYVTSSDKRYRKPTHLIDLTKINLNQQVTRNFKLSEFMQASKGRYAFFAEHVFGFVQNIRDQLGTVIRVNSAFRSPAYNKKIGGASISRHMYGDGLDLSGSTMAKMQAACRAQGASFIQLYNDGHIHCDWRSHTLDGTFYQTAAPALSAARVANMSEDQFKAMQIDSAGQPIIAFEGDARVGQEIQLTASLETQEEAEPLLTEWIIRAPNGQVVMSSEPVLKYKLEQSGAYTVYVKLGGYSDISYQLDVP